MALFCLIASALWLVVALGGLIAAFSSADEEAGFFGFLGFMFIVGIVAALNILPICNHINDVTFLRNADQYIAVKQEAISEIDSQLKSATVPAALMNADTPYAQLVQTKADFVNQITQERVKKLDAAVSIERRKMGPSAWVIWLYGDK